ncbi:MAG: DUF4215 domain-containing protein [Candidatus Peribacteraceae bacterium]|nr:DUF4215 domain-containing protein [Candidatus Peribacteraceae bacterium]
MAFPLRPRTVALTLSGLIVVLLLAFAVLSESSFSPAAMRGQVTCPLLAACTTDSDCEEIDLGAGCSGYTCISLTCGVACSTPAAPGAPDLEAASDTGISTTDNYTKNTTPTFTGTCTTGYTVKLMLVGAQVGSNYTCAGGAYSIAPTSALSEGAKALTATQTTPEGCLSGDSASLTVNIDTSLTGSFSPADDATGVGLTDNLVITSGVPEGHLLYAAADKNIVIKKTSNNSLVETIAANNMSLVSISTASLIVTITIDPISTLEANTEYYVLIDSGAFTDVSGNEYAGISSTTAWSFTTVTSSCGDGTVGGSEACDQGANNGVSGYCCTAGCAFTTAGTSCRAATTTCDAAESCTGSSATCPADAYTPSSTECQAADTIGDCYAAAYCTGSSTTCPDRGAATAGTSCRASTNNSTTILCDKADVCDGSSTSCTNIFESGLVVLGGVCCSGTSATATTTSCQVACRDGNVDAGEKCDDGNQNNNDMCSNVCTIAKCGDGIVQGVAGESCDDGNTDNNDGCRNNCTVGSDGGSTGGGMTGGGPGGGIPGGGIPGGGIPGGGVPGGIPGGGIPGGGIPGGGVSGNTSGCVPVTTSNSSGSPGASPEPPKSGFEKFVTMLLEMVGVESAPPVTTWDCSSPRKIRCCTIDGHAYGKAADGTFVTDDAVPPGVSVNWGVSPKDCALKNAIGDQADPAALGVCDSTVIEVPIDDNGDGVADSTGKFVCLKSSTAGYCQTSGGKIYTKFDGGMGGTTGGAATGLGITGGGGTLR